MTFIETFVAYDENAIGYYVDVNEILFKPLSGRSDVVKDYSLSDTGELIKAHPDNNKAFWVESKKMFIIDMR